MPHSHLASAVYFFDPAISFHPGTDDFYIGQVQAAREMQSAREAPVYGLSGDCEKAQE